ncbi:MAG: hypothetical protein ACUVTP_11110 [Candidatus Fervidibacter sp.]|uniref:hypothetical protein n=1 Tax=Candidatus Fervidibacter sp. TaxID=3100871 RepID=UPI004049530B
MRWLIFSVIAIAFLLVGWAVGQRTQDEKQAVKLSELEKRLTDAERKIAELEMKVSELSSQVKKISQRQIVPVPYFAPHPLTVVPLFEWRFPEGRQGFGLPKPAPQPFVQPYYYPLKKQP